MIESAEVKRWKSSEVEVKLGTGEAGAALYALA
jgi:hypothetical protein